VSHKNNNLDLLLNPYYSINFVIRNPYELIMSSIIAHYNSNNKKYTIKEHFNELVIHKERLFYTLIYFVDMLNDLEKKNIKINYIDHKNISNELNNIIKNNNIEYVINECSEKYLTNNSEKNIFNCDTVIENIDQRLYHSTYENYYDQEMIDIVYSNLESYFLKFNFSATYGTKIPSCL
jgi:hypothetical protein